MTLSSEWQIEFTNRSEEKHQFTHHICTHWNVRFRQGQKCHFCVVPSAAWLTKQQWLHLHLIVVLKICILAASFYLLPQLIQVIWIHFRHNAIEEFFYHYQEPNTVHYARISYISEPRFCSILYLHFCSLCVRIAQNKIVISNALQLCNLSQTQNNFTCNKFQSFGPTNNQD